MPPFSTGPKGGMTNPSNDTRHNRVDPVNRSGGPIGRFAGRGTGSNPGSQAGVSRTAQTPMSSRGGFGQQGRDKQYASASIRGTKGSSGNPASRGGFNGEARGGSFQPQARVAGHGGSPQVRERHGSNFALRGGFGSSGQGRDNKHAMGSLPNYGPTNPSPASGNTSGRSYRLIAGRFKRAAMGASASQGNSGSFGGGPVSTNT